MQSPSAVDPFGTGRLPIGAILNKRYKIVRKIAQGGMGAVYEAKEIPESPTGRRLAIKEMSFSMLDRIQENQRKAVVDSFHREFDLLSKLDHPNLVRAFEFFEEQGRQFFVMEYVEGRTLESLLENLPLGVFFPFERVMDWAHQLCNALYYLHSQNPPIIYRDLKPSNIIEVSGSHLVKLFDFGIARYYKPGQQSDTLRFGTDGYLAPEIISDQIQSSILTDVFALGAVLHQLLTRYDPQIDPWRRPPIRSINPAVPGNVLKAIERALSYNPKSRPQNAIQVLRDLFGDQAESEITNISMENPFKVQATPLIQATTDQQPPVPLQSFEVDQGSPAEFSVARKLLDLGKVQHGKIISRQYNQTSLLPGGGTLSTEASWLKIIPEQHASGIPCITILATAEDLPISTWEEAAKPEWFTMIPDPLRSWIGLHARFFIPRPLVQQGIIYVSKLNSTASQIEVQVEVQPPVWVSFIGWLFVLSLMSMELLIIGGCLLFLILNLA